MNKLLVSVAVCCFLISSMLEAKACMVFRIKAKDGTMIIGRTMEFGLDVKSNLVIVPRGKEFVSPAPGNKGGFKWKSKYGYVGTNVFGHEDIVFDGMNEEGLAMSALWYETDMKWQEVPQSESASAIANVLAGSWLLGNFKDVASIKAELPKRKVFSYVIPQMGVTPPVHLIAYDRQGKSIVVEYENGEVHIYENKLDLMTNAPNFPFMLANLRQYIGSSPEQVKTEDFSGLKLPSTGHGAGMFGIPGDITPPSRFVRLALLTHFAEQANDATGALNLAQHIVNTFDIIRGISVDRDAAGKITAQETTQWSSYRDQTNLAYYFRTYDNFNLRKISFSKLDFTSSKVKVIPMTGDNEMILDVSDRAR